MTYSILISYIIYIVTFIISAFFAGLYAKKRNFSKFLYLFLAVSIPAYLSAIRGIGVGTDYVEYVRHIEELIKFVNWSLNFSDLDSKFEFGFNFLIFVITRFTEFIPLVVFFIYAFIAFFVVKACKNLMPYEMVFWGYLFYLATFWLFGFNGLRQAIAIAIVFYSLTFVKEKKILPFILTIILAMSFHNTALIVAPLYFIINSKSEKKERIVFALTIVGIILASFFLETASGIFGYDSYLSSKYVQKDNVNAILKIVQSILLLFPFIIWRKKLTRINPFNKLYYRMLYLFMTTLLLSLQITQATRITLYLEIASIMIAVETIRYYLKNRNKTDTLFLIYIFFYFIVYKFIYLHASGSGEVIPYSLFKFN